MDSYVHGWRKRVRHPSLTRALGLALAVVLARSAPTSACDICAVYTATEQRESRVGLRLGLATQYSHFNSLQDGGHDVPNPEGEYIESVTNQLVFGYQLTPRFSLQANLPIVVRQYRRVEQGGRVRGNVAGPGDLSLLANLLAYSAVTETSVFRFSLFGGLKLPTGDPAFLAEELDEGGEAAAVSAHHEAPAPGGGGSGEGSGGDEHAHEASGVHGHDLALGSGSVDGIVGGNLYLSWERLFFTGTLQYAARREGAFEYRYANDLSWSGGPGVYALLGHDYSLAVLAGLSGDTKGKDEQQGRRLDDTAVTNLYLGPAFQLTWGTSLFAEAGVDLPVVQHNTALQIVADYRVRTAAVWRF